MKFEVNLTLFLVSVIISSGFCHFENIKSKSKATVQAKAASDVITRLLGSEKARLFDIKVDKSLSENGKDTFRIVKKDEDSAVTVTGSSGVAATWGVHHYLRRHCGCHVSWDGDQLRLPDTLPSVDVTVASLDRFKYYQNVCTSSYSFVWWNWSRWEREIDWMALNGINLALAFTAQEAIWRRVYDGLGLESYDFTGPAFLAWNRMGNMRSFGGGLFTSWHSETLALQHKILDRMRELGIVPVLPAFAGQVPKSFVKSYPSAKVSNVSRWNDFQDEFCCPYLLNPTDPLFPVVGRIFLKEYIAEFGTDHVYNCDTFNENTPDSDEPAYLASTSEAIFDAITEIDPLATWMLQGWMFINPFWGNEQVKAYVTSVPIGRMLILDLQSDLTPQYDRLDSYYGQPFIWCTLHNFGGQLGLYGHLEKINQGIPRGRNFPNSTMIGIGITPEGIDQNYVMYDFTLDSSTRSSPIDLSEWISDYASRRYGAVNEDADLAWQILKSTAYDYNLEYDASKKRGPSTPYGDHIAKNILTKLPSLMMTEVSWYDKSQILNVFENFVAASNDSRLSSSELFRHDFVDVTRQTIQFAVSALYAQMMDSYLTNHLENFQNASVNFLQILDDLDEVLASGKKFLLGKWLEDAKSWATNENESVWYEYNARNQITLWGPYGEIRDYAAKQWAGLVKDYYKPRWQIFVKAVNDSLTDEVDFNSTRVREEIFSLVEEPFTRKRDQHPSRPQGDSLQIIDLFNQNWFSFLKQLFNSEVTTFTVTQN